MNAAPSDHEPIDPTLEVEAPSTKPVAPADKQKMDRRSRVERRKGERRESRVPVNENRRSDVDRRAGPRRTKRNINQYDMEQETLEFIRAINRFKERSGKSFPTWTEVLTILKELGYERRQ